MTTPGKTGTMPAGGAKPAGPSEGATNPPGSDSRPTSSAAKQPMPWAAKPMTREELAHLPAGASSQVALVRATRGTIERIGRIQTRNAFVLNIDGRRFVYLRPQALRQDRDTSYRPDGLKKTLDQGRRYTGRHLDHVASTGVEGGRVGMAYVLAAFVSAGANTSAGRTNEKGPAPVREAARAFQGGIDRDDRHHVTYMTQEMVDKLAGKNSAGRGHSTFHGTPSSAELQEIRRALMQETPQQQHLRALTGGRSDVPQDGPARTRSASR